MDLDVGHQAKRPLPERRPRKYNRRMAAARRLRYYDNMAAKLEGKPSPHFWARWSINHLEGLRDKVARLTREAKEQKRLQREAEEQKLKGSSVQKPA